MTTTTLDNFSPMTRSEAMAKYEAMVFDPSKYTADDLHRVLPIIGLTEGDFLSTRNRRREIDSLDRQIAAAEQSENDELAMANAEVQASQEKIGAAKKALDALIEQNSLLMVKLIAAGHPVEKLKARRGQLILAQRAADARLQNPNGSAPGMTFPTVGR
jgi:hypothetical protein